MAFLRYANRIGFPCIESISATSDGTNTTITFNPHLGPNRFFGGFWVKIPQTVETGTEPVLFATSGVPNTTVPLYLSSGALATTANIATTGGVFLCFYDIDTNRVTLIS